MPRRSFLVQASAGSALLVSSSSSLYGTLAGRHDYQLPEVAVSIPGLSRQFDGFTIAQLSDVHIGQFVGPAQLAAAEDLLSRAKADLIVLTGDLLDHDVRRSAELGRFVRRLVPLARHGVVAITGNHDFYAGVDAVVAAVRAAGGRVLRNQAEVLGDQNAGLALLGVDDLYGVREGSGPNLAGAMETLPRLAGLIAPARDLPRVLLCHQPVFFEQSAPHVNLQLSGHTHGGQVNLLVRPADWVLPHGWVAGLYERDGARLYVNRGFGTAGPPARIGAAPEVTRLVLVSS
jgi:predicted MPP superfamily phosphohydrolase